MKQQKKQNTTISRILVPTDFSTCSTEALEYAMALAKPLKADLILAHVIQPFPYNLVEGTTFADYGYGDRLTPQVQRLLDELSKRPLKEKLSVETHLISGAPFREIIKLAKREGADLIVMGTHGRSGVDRLIIGSVAEKVVRLSPCPVLTVHSAPAVPKRRTVKQRQKTGAAKKKAVGF